MFHCMARKQKLNHVMSVKTDTQKSTSRPGSIQCKNNLHFVPLSQAQQGRKTFVFLFSRNLLLTKTV